MSMHECHHAHIPSHSPTPSHLPRASVKYQQSFCSTNDLFQNKNFCFLLKIGNPLEKPPMHIGFGQIACVYVFVGHGFFGFSPPDAARRSNISTNLHRQDSCLTVNKIWVFHPGGGSTPSCYAQTHLYLFPLVSKPFDSFGLCPITRVHQSVPYTVFDP